MVATQALVFGKRARSDSKIGESLFNTNHLSVILSSPPLNENHHLHFPNNLCGDTCTVPCLERSGLHPPSAAPVLKRHSKEPNTPTLTPIRNPSYTRVHSYKKLKRRQILRWRAKIAEKVRKRLIFSGVDPGAEH